MRYSQIAVAMCLAAVFPFKQAPAFADQTYGSYAADGRCYCNGEQPASVRSRIVPTPIGGQSVAQVCKRVGQGPVLEKTDGVYNFPVYKDPQCGNGPFEQAITSLDENCLGTTDGTYGTCKGVGPRWDLVSAFRHQRSPAAAKPTPVDGAGQNVVTTSRVDDKRGDSTESLRAIVIRSPSVSGRELPATIKGQEGSSDNEALTNFTGRSINIAGDRYLQARSDLPAHGGAAGSRIILDGLVFLKDDGTIDPADLFQEPRKPAKPSLVQQSERSSSSSTDSASSSTSDRSSDKAAQAEIRASEKAAKEDRALAALRLQRKAISERQKTESETSDIDFDDKRDIAAVDVERAKDERAKREAALDSRLSLLAEAKARKEAQASRVQASSETQVDPKQPQILVEKKRDAPLDSAVENTAEIVEQVNNQSAATVAADAEPVLAGAIGLPGNTRPGFGEYAYIEASPVNFDIGGNGIMLEGSTQSHSHIQYLGRVSMTETFSNVLLGVGYFLKPPQSDRLRVLWLAGLEHGRFELTDDVNAPEQTINSTDTGWYIGVETRLLVTRKFELKGGVSYSSYFEGDPRISAGTYYHITPRLDILSRFELGDNDLLGIGVRYYY